VYFVAVGVILGYFSILISRVSKSLFAGKLDRVKDKSGKKRYEFAA
jgi:hypothetical protein